MVTASKTLCGFTTQSCARSLNQNRCQVLVGGTPWMGPITHPHACVRAAPPSTGFQRPYGISHGKHGGVLRVLRVLFTPIEHLLSEVRKSDRACTGWKSIIFHAGFDDNSDNTLAFRHIVIAQCNQLSAVFWRLIAGFGCCVCASADPARATKRTIAYIERIRTSYALTTKRRRPKSTPLAAIKSP